MGNDVHDFFDESVLPELKSMINDNSDTEETKFEGFLRVLKRTCQNNNFKATVIRTLLDPFGDNQDCYKTIQDIFVLLSDNQIEKLVYLDDNTRVSIDFNAESPE